MQYYSVLESDTMCFETTWTENVPEPHEGLYINFSGSGGREPSLVLPRAGRPSPICKSPCSLRRHRQPRGLCFCPWSLPALSGQSQFPITPGSPRFPTNNWPASGRWNKASWERPNLGANLCVGRAGLCVRCCGPAQEFLGTGTHCKQQLL